MSTMIATGGQSGERPAEQPERPERRPTARSVLMCRPEHFTVVYRINPWMDPAAPTDTGLALAQWQVLHDTFVGLGYDVQLIDPIEGLPDMVYAANVSWSTCHCASARPVSVGAAGSIHGVMR